MGLIDNTIKLKPTDNAYSDSYLSFSEKIGDDEMYVHINEGNDMYITKEQAIQIINHLKQEFSI